MIIKKLKALFLITVLILATVLLYSCKIGDGGEGQGDDGTDIDSGSGDTVGDSGDNGSSGDSLGDASSEYIFASGIPTKIVTNADEKLDTEALKSTLEQATGSYTLISYGADEAEPHEIIIGNVSTRTLSERAYRKLGRMAEEDGESSSWLIYSDGTSVAVAYTDVIALDSAVKELKEKYISRGEMVMPAGKSIDKTFGTASYVENMNRTEREVRFKALEDELGLETVDAIRALYSLYGQEVYLWLVNLYDPEVGGFYYSNSGRDNVGYLPDIESTAQALNHLQSSGMFDNYEKNYSVALPEEIKAQLLHFARGLQSEHDGYFYHPQWGTDIIVARRGRDYGWALGIIDRLGSQPYYSTGSYTGLYGAPGGVSGVSVKVGRLGLSATVAVSKVVATDASKANLPEYLKSLDKWAKYIDSLNIPTDSYTAGNTLAAQHADIENAGKEYVDYLINYLNEHQDPVTGTWEVITPEEDQHGDKLDGVDYSNVNGLMKLASVYNYYNVPVPNLEAALESCIKVALYPNDEGDNHVCCTYNPWITMDIILKGAGNKKAGGSPELVKKLRDRILEVSDELVLATVDKIKEHKRADGGFSYFERALSLTSQKALVACSSVVEGDVNATCISTTGIATNVFDCFGVKMVPLWYGLDGEYFLSTISNMGAIIKNEAQPVEPVTFDYYQSDSDNEKGGVFLSPASTATAKIRDEDKIIGADGNYKYFTGMVIDDPAPSREGDKAYRVNNRIYYEPDADGNPVKTYAKTALTTYFEIPNSFIVGNAFNLETDLYVKSSSENGCVMQIFFTRSVEDPSHSFSLNVNTYTKDGKKYFKIGDNFEGPDGERDGNLATDLPTDEWVKLRIEVYKVYDVLDDGATGKTLQIFGKIFVNGEFCATSEASYTSANNPTVVQEKSIAAIGFSFYRTTGSTVYLDNVLCEKSDTQYVPEYLPPDPPPEYIPTLNGVRGTGEYYTAFNSGNISGKLYDFESPKQKKPTLSGGIAAATYLLGIPEEGDTESARDAYVYFYRLTGGTHEYVIHKAGVGTAPEGVDNPTVITEFDAAFGNADKNLFTMIAVYGNGFRTSVYFTPKDGKIGFGNVSEDYFFEPLNAGEWYNFRFETYLLDPKAGYNNANVRTKVYINGEYSIELNGVDVSANSSEQAIIQMQYTDDDAWMCYDNLYLGYADKSYALPTLPKPEGLPENLSGTLGTGEYYNGTADGVRHDYDNGEAKPSPSEGSISRTYLSDTEEKILYFYKFIDSNEANLQSSLNYYIPTKPDNATAIVLECDIAFSGLSVDTSDAQRGAASVQISFTENKWLGSFFVGYNKNTGKIEFMNGTLLDGKNISLEENTFYNLRMVVYLNMEGESTALVYIDGEYVGEHKPGDNKSTGSSASRLGFVLRQLEYDDWIVLDNLYLGYTDLPYSGKLDSDPEGGTTNPGEGGEGGETEGGETPKPGEGETQEPDGDGGSLGNGNHVDSGGWTEEQ